MFSLLLSLMLPVVAGGGAVDTAFTQVAPPLEFVYATAFTRSPEKTRAVILLHGLYIHTVSSAGAMRAEFHNWQKPDSLLVHTLAVDSDVYAFAYGQNLAIEDVAACPELPIKIRDLKRLGYTEIVLIGHSAGGLIARMFVEDHPNAGVTKVIQICTPNGGTSWAKAAFAARNVQGPFIRSLSKESRCACQQLRGDKKIPDHIEFVTVVANGAAFGDGLVSNRSQWTEDLQAQNIPAVTLTMAHFNVVRGERGVAKIAQLVREKQPRWTPEQVGATKQKILKIY
jgi:hypothetical protein